MIDVTEYINKLEELKSRASIYVDLLAFSYKYHMRIITDVPIVFPNNYEYVNHDSLIEVSEVPWNKHERGGWSKPDIEFMGIEIRYLWKQFKPISI